MARKSRLAAPVVVAALIGTGAAVVPQLDASATPHLPSISAKALIAKAASDKVSHLSGTVRWTADLGLPSLSELTSGNGQSVNSASGFDPTSLLSGTQDFHVWVAGPQRERVQIPGSLEETDVVRDGTQLWVWQSSTSHVTHYILKSGRPAHVATASPMPSGSRMGNGTWTGQAPDQSAAAAQEANPQTVASHILKALNQSTTGVSVAAPEKVAGRDAYVLRLAPDRSVAANRDSTIGSVEIAVDAQTGLPLRVTVYAEGSSKPALEVGYTSISYAEPSGSDLTAPKGQTTTTKVVQPHMDKHGDNPEHQGDSSLTGNDWGTIAVLSAGRYANSPELRSATTAVSGSWGSGRLLTSNLINALFLPNGKVLVGMVTPAALEAAAAQAG
jgi:outer membrane lipoprotein-sorting protein